MVRKQRMKAGTQLVLSFYRKHPHSVKPSQKVLRDIHRGHFYSVLVLLVTGTVVLLSVSIAVMRHLHQSNCGEEEFISAYDS